MACLADGFRDVEAAGDMRKFIRCLAAIEDLADFRAYKEGAIANLGLTADARVADVACGLGFDLVRLHRLAPAGMVVGFDASAALLDNARRTVAGCGNVAARRPTARRRLAANGRRGQPGGRSSQRTGPHEAAGRTQHVVIRRHSSSSAGADVVILRPDVVMMSSFVVIRVAIVWSFPAPSHRRRRNRSRRPGRPL